MRKRYWVSALIATGVLAAGAALNAQPPRHAGHGAEHGQAGHGAGLLAHIHEHLHQHMEALNLTQEQREAVHGVLQAHRAEIAGAFAPVLKGKRALHEAIMADTPNEAAIKAAASTLGDSIGSAAVTIARIKVEVVEKAKLTAEQKRKIQEMRADAAAAVDEALKALEGAGEKKPE